MHATTISMSLSNDEITDLKSAGTTTSRWTRPDRSIRASNKVETYFISGKRTKGMNEFRIAGGGRPGDRPDGRRRRAFLVSVLSSAHAAVAAVAAATKRAQ